MLHLITNYIDFDYYSNKELENKYITGDEHSDCNIDCMIAVFMISTMPRFIFSCISVYQRKGHFSSHADEVNKGFKFILISHR